MYLLTHAAFSAFLLGYGSGSVTAQEPKTLDEFINRATTRSNAGDFDGAIKDFTEALRIDPKNVLAYNNRGIARKGKGDLGGAIKDYDEAIRLDPKLAKAYFNRGIARKIEGDLDGAIKDYDEAIRIDPKYLFAHINRGNARYRRGDLDGAIKDYDETIRIDPKYPTAYSNRGYTRAVRGDLNGAMKDIEEAIRLRPGYGNALKDRAWVTYLRGDYRQVLDVTLGALPLIKPGADRDMTTILGMAARLRLGEKDAASAPLKAVFEGRRGGLTTEEWPASIAAFLRREITEAEFLKQKESVKLERKEVVGGAWFYAGILRLSEGDAATAKTYFERCVKDSDSEVAEWSLAKVELERMRERK